MRLSLCSALSMLLAANLLGGNAVALGQTNPAPTSPKQASVADGKGSLIVARCKQDTAKLCAGVAPGGGRLATCLGSHQSELSASCKAALPPECLIAGDGAANATASGMDPVAGMRRACSADIEKLCKDVPQGRGRIAMCLNQHASELSAGCKPAAQVIATKMNERRQMHADCAADVQRLCADMPAGPGRTGFCLGEHANELSSACKKHVDEMKSHAGKTAKSG